MHPPPKKKTRHGRENKHRERKKRKTIYQIPTRQRRKETKKLKERHGGKKKKELQDKNISHYLLSTIFLIPRLSIHLRPSVSIEMCPKHQQAAHTLCPYKAIPLRGRLQSLWVGEQGRGHQITQRCNNWRLHSRRLVSYGKAKKKWRDLDDLLIISLPFHHLFHLSYSPYH